MDAARPVRPSRLLTPSKRIIEQGKSTSNDSRHSDCKDVQACTYTVQLPNNINGFNPGSARTIIAKCTVTRPVEASSSHVSWLGQCVRWENGRCIKCPGSRARVRRRTVSLRSALPDSLEPVSVFDGSQRSTPDWFARRYFRLRGCGRQWLRICTSRASSRGPRPAYG